ncbi:MAG: hypothetical protein GTO24_04895 [candidate division Zixibacteria bacterium]|nr:hypothetical protein [candidate division Zixibacteria bacterium]
MKKIAISLLFIYVCFFSMSLGDRVFAGQYHIKSMDFDGDCVKVVYGTTENDSRDRGHLEVLTYTWGSKSEKWNKVNRTARGVGGLRSGKKYYKEFCGIGLHRGRVKVIVKIYHNRRLEDRAGQVFDMD